MTERDRETEREPRCRHCFVKRLKRQTSRPDYAPFSTPGAPTCTYYALLTAFALYHRHDGAACNGIVVSASSRVPRRKKTRRGRHCQRRRHARLSVSPRRIVVEHRARQVLEDKGGPFFYGPFALTRPSRTAMLPRLLAVKRNARYGFIAREVDRSLQVAI